jgi:hypothetical protein
MIAPIVSLPRSTTPKKNFSSFVLGGKIGSRIVAMSSERTNVRRRKLKRTIVRFQEAEESVVRRSART